MSVVQKLHQAIQVENQKIQESQERIAALQNQLSLQSQLEAAKTPEKILEIIDTRSAEEKGVTPQSTLEHLTIQALQQVGRPQQRDQLYQLLVQRGAKLGGSDPMQNLSVKLGRMSKLHNIPNHGFWLRHVDFAPANYKAQPIQ